MSTSTTLLSSIVETTLPRNPGDQHTVTTFNPAGETHAAAIVTAVISEYHRLTCRTKPTPQAVHALAGSKVTLAYRTTTMLGAPSIEGIEGTVFLGSSRSGQAQLGLLPKRVRRNGIALDPSRVLDIEPGYGHLPALQARITAVRAGLPAVEELTRAHLLALPEDAPEPTRIGLAVFGTWTMPDVVSPAVIWLLHSYQPEHDIAEGYLLIRDQDGVSEHGSLYGRQLLAVGGRILNPPPLTLAEAMELGDLPHHQWLATFATTTPAPAATPPAADPH